MAKPPTSTRTVRLPDALWEKLAKRAEETGMSVNALVAAGADMATTILVHRSDVAADARRAKAEPTKKLVNRLKGTWTPPGKAKR